MVKCPAGSQSKAPSPLRSAGALHKEFHRCKGPAAKDDSLGKTKKALLKIVMTDENGHQGQR
jgi:hypothetical protein